MPSGSSDNRINSICPSESRLHTSMESTSLFRIPSLHNQAIDDDVRFLVFGFFQGLHRLGQVHNLTVDQEAHVALLLQSGQNDRQPLFRFCRCRPACARAGPERSCCLSAPSNARRMQR